MLLKDLIRNLQDLYLQQARGQISEPEIFIDTFRQADSAGNFEYCGLSDEIEVQISNQSRRLIISAMQVDDTQISGFNDIQEEDDSRKMDFKYQLSLLSEFPRVQAMIGSTWGTAKCRQYIYGLIIDDRPGRENSKVQGFPAHIYATINNLFTIHNSTFPQHIPPVPKWEVNR